MKALGIAERRGLDRFVSQQIHYTLQAREAEYELVPIAVDQGLGLLVWSPLVGGLLTDKYCRDQPGPQESRLLSGWDEPPVRPGQIVRHRRGPGRGGLRARPSCP
jgi:aryl-alcohol dehydrogenase-like predicted oxidoreductase